MPRAEALSRERRGGNPVILTAHCSSPAPCGGTHTSQLVYHKGNLPSHFPRVGFFSLACSTLGLHQHHREGFKCPELSLVITQGKKPQPGQQCHLSFSGEFSLQPAKRTPRAVPPFAHQERKSQHLSHILPPPPLLKTEQKDPARNTN